jgi:diguanylate cyclase
MVEKSSDVQGIDWRAKYLDALDAQESLERQLSQYQELMRRALIRVSLSADGQDDQLDAALESLRDSLRTQGQDFIPDLAHMDESLRAFEDRRQQAQQAVSQALEGIVIPLRKLPVSRRLNKELRHYLSQLPDRTRKIRLYPALLQQLADLQQQALAELQGTGQGLWKRLLNKTPQDEADLSDEDEKFSTTEDADTSSSGQGAASLSDANSSLRLAEGITQLLLHLLDDIDVPESMVERVDELKRQLAPGLEAGQVLGALESVRNLVMEAYLAANKAFATYLNNVNLELSDIYAAIGGAVRHQTAHLETTSELKTSVMRQMQEMEAGTARATDLDQLKNMVQSQLGNIRQALHEFQQSEQDQRQLSSQLQELGEKIKAMEAEAERNRTTLEKHRYKALHDPLTELPNREAYNERIAAEFQRWRRYKHPLTLAICDLDHFKKINDSLGHQAGDRVLKVISRSIAKRLRQVDFFGRYGGEEFVVIMPETNSEQACSVLEKIRIAIAETAFNYKGQPLPITLSMGITQFRDGDTIDSAFARADEALYSAKADGRNRVHLS